DQRETAQYRALAGYPEHFKRPHADKRADHEHVEMREIDQLEDAIDEREAERQQGVHRAEAQPIDDLLQQNRIDDPAASTLMTRFVMSPFSSKLTSPCSVLTFEAWIASRILARLTSLPPSATRLIESMMTSAAS